MTTLTCYMSVIFFTVRFNLSVKINCVTDLYKKLNSFKS